MGLRKNSTSGMVDVKHHISWKVNSQTVDTYDEDLVSFIKDRVLSPMLSSKKQLGYNALNHSLCSPRRGQICSKITLHLIICAFSLKSVADVSHFLSFDLFRIKPFELNHKEYDNNMHVICYHTLHTFSTMCFTYWNEINTNSCTIEYLIQYRLLPIISNYCSYMC